MAEIRLKFTDMDNTIQLSILLTHNHPFPWNGWINWYRHVGSQSVLFLNLSERDGWEREGPQRRGETRGGVRQSRDWGVVSCSRKYSIKEEPDPGDWDFAWRQVTVGLPRTHSKVGLKEPKHTSKTAVVPKRFLRRKKWVLVPPWPALSPWSHPIKYEFMTTDSHWLFAHSETYVHAIIVFIPCSVWKKHMVINFLKIVHTFMCESGEQNSFSNKQVSIT